MFEHLTRFGVNRIDGAAIPIFNKVPYNAMTQLMGVTRGTNDGHTTGIKEGIKHQNAPANLRLGC